tara:strand:- start:759 stop:1400 length:642 start_codon:yes stop_codon:yes gene_type:complete
MGYIIIAPVGDNTKALFVGMKDFPTEKVILITPDNYLNDAKKLQKDLNQFTIDSEIMQIGDNLMEEMFRVFGKICSMYKNDEIIVNVATGDRMSTCAALSAAFANGLKSIGVVGNKCMLLPIMKLSYYNELSETKLKILKELEGKDWVSLQNLSKVLNISISLTSYHINGNLKYKGLKEFRLVEVKEQSKNVFVKISSMGSLLFKGYIDQKSE